MRNFLLRQIMIVLQLVQWLVSMAVAACFAMFMALAFSFHNKGVDAPILFIAAVFAAFVAVALSPPVLFRFPVKARLAIYALIIPAVVANIWTSTNVNEAYKRTPRGVLEAKNDAAAEAYRLQSDNIAKANRANLEFTENYRNNISASNQKIQECINWRGQVPALVEYVKSGLHNPDSFEHVQTGTIEPGETIQVVMQYRGENGFGAIRTESVRAILSPKDCAVVEVKPY